MSPRVDFRGRGAHIERMLKFAPILIALLVGYLTFRFSTHASGKRLDANSAELIDPKLAKVFAPLADALDVERIRVNLLEEPAVNALAAHDGRVFITRGMYDKFLQGEITDEEIASVVAHELGHVALGHSKRRMIDFSGQNALRTGLAMILSRFIPFVGAWIAHQLVSLLSARISRADEYEADAYASALMIKSGFGTGAQKALFDKLDRLTGANGKGMPAWFLSHPKAVERIAAIEKNEQKWGVGS